MQQKTEKNEALTEGEKAELVRLQQKDQKAETEGRKAESAAKVLTQEEKTLTEKERAELIRLQQKTEKNEALTEKEKAELVRLQQKDEEAITKTRFAESAAKVLTQEAKTLTEKEKAELIKLQQKTEKQETLTEKEATRLKQLQQYTEGKKAGKLSQEIASNRVKTFDDSNLTQARTNQIQEKTPFEVEALKALTVQRQGDTKTAGYDEKDIKPFVSLWSGMVEGLPNWVETAPGSPSVPKNVRVKLRNSALQSWVPYAGSGDPIGEFKNTTKGMTDPPVPIGSTTWGGNPEFYAPATIFNELRHDIKKTPGLLDREPGRPTNESPNGSPSSYDIVLRDLVKNQGFTEDQAIKLIEAASK